jgi:hypothetical protein
MDIYYNYSIDCELPPDGVFGGPTNWQVAEDSTRGFIDAMDRLGVLDGATLFVYPDVAMKQKILFRELADQQIEIALHLHGMRYSRISNKKWMGEMTYHEQKAAIQMAIADLEEVVQQPCLGYRACYASANNDTFPILEELGFTWSSTSASGSYKPAIYACWSGGWSFPYHPSRVNKLIPGDLSIYEVPLTRGLRTFFMNDPERPMDMRVETPVEIRGDNFECFSQIITENVTEMEKRDQPIRVIIGASHNTNLYGDASSLAFQNLEGATRLAKEITLRIGHSFIPASFNTIKNRALDINAF